MSNQEEIHIQGNSHSKFHIQEWTQGVKRMREEEKRLGILSHILVYFNNT